ncbi:MAG TPA: helix-turn-helix transcriptional regulator [Pseudonocardiaceae bacterium]|nr:helix-turn-helix transcriptional regulator [Pseudonocardiaceae bacterium]
MSVVRRSAARYRYRVTQQQGSEAGYGWLQRDRATAVDDAGSVLLAWRTTAERTQTEVAGVLGTTQQHLSQLEQGRRPVSLELRRRMVTELGIAAEDLGLSATCARKLLSRDDASPQIAASRLRWRDERRWLNQHRAELAKLTVQLYPAEHRLPHTTMIAPPEWLPVEPLELGSLALRLDEGPQTTVVNGTEPESELTRPLRTARLTFRAIHLGDEASEPAFVVRVPPQLPAAGRFPIIIAPDEVRTGQLLRQDRRL